MHRFFAPLFACVLLGCGPIQVQLPPWRVPLDEHITLSTGPTKRTGVPYEEVVYFRARCEDESICTIIDEREPMGHLRGDPWSVYTVVPKKPGRTTMVVTMEGERHEPLEIERGELIVDKAPPRDVLSVALPLPRTETSRLESAPPLYRSRGGAPPARCVDATRASPEIRSRFAGIDEPGVRLFICMAAHEVAPGKFLWRGGWQNQIVDGVASELFACARSEGGVVTALTLLVDPKGTHTYQIAETRGSSAAVCAPRMPTLVAQ